MNTTIPAGKRRATAVAAPGVAGALLAKLACPACWPLYTGLLSALGIGLTLDTSVAMPLAAVFLAIALASLGHRARSRRGYGPLVLGSAGALGIFGGEFVFHSEALAYLGVPVLIVASLWHAWPRRTPARDGCDTCAPAAVKDDRRSTQITQPRGEPWH